MHDSGDYMKKWLRKEVTTDRGIFEIFIKGEGEPLCVTHYYSSYNNTGDYFAESFTKTNTVYLVNLREAGNSVKASLPYQLSMLESILDLESIRKSLEVDRWGFAGHSTGGILGVVYGIYFSRSLHYLVLVGATAREYVTFSEDCIYNQKHPDFEEMQFLTNELMQSKSISEKKRLKKRRTQLSLLDPQKYETYFSLDIQKEISATRLAFYNREMHVFDVTKKLKLIDIPCLIICGKYDVQCPLLYSIEMHDLILDSNLVVFEESNHYPFLEEEDQFKKEYYEFFYAQFCRSRK
ncbi:hypothetical conserved protein [Oceanobacillus iheyensis HTE831]|uniref:Hypothetical conserved protein n=2 Tax=Oceanobacillus iheyensis TaxID=182710 RepID=Q8ERN7_OCEIH|nr:hypothetical conserved protein [Oceanobacillus iheyensis HTE831]